MNSPTKRFIEAAKQGDLDVIQKLSMNVDVSYNNNNALRLAARKGHLEVVKYLATLQNPVTGDYRVDVSANDNFALRLAALNGHLEVVKYLSTLVDPVTGDYRVDVSADNNQALRYAAYLKIIKFLKYKIAQKQGYSNQKLECIQKVLLLKDLHKYIVI